MEAEIEAMRSAQVEAAAARAAAAQAEREAAEATRRRESAEAQAALELARAREFVWSHDEKVERVRQYAEAVEQTISKVEAEKDAAEARWRQASDAGVRAAKLQNALELASARHAAMETSEQARSQARKAKLDVAVAEAAAAAERARACKAVLSTSLLATSEEEAREAASRNAARRRAAEARLRALTLELAATKADHEAQRSRGSKAEAAALVEAEARVRALDRQLTACRAEVASVNAVNSSRTNEVHLQALSHAHAMQLQQAEMGKRLCLAESAVKHCPKASSGLHPQVLEQGVADAAAVLEHATAEAKARAHHADAVAKAKSESDKELSAMREACAAEKLAAEREAAQARLSAVERAAGACESARIKAETAREEAYKDYFAAVRPAEADSDKALAAAAMRADGGGAGGAGGGRGGTNGGGGAPGGGGAHAPHDPKMSSAAKRSASNLWAAFTATLFKGNGGEDEAKLKEVFDSIDVDGGGTIDKEELRQALRLHGREQTDAQITKMMRIGDEDGDGDIDFDEFVHIMKVRARVSPCVPAPRLASYYSYRGYREHTQRLLGSSSVDSACAAAAYSPRC